MKIAITLAGVERTLYKSCACPFEISEESRALLEKATRLMDRDTPIEWRCACEAKR